MPATTKRTRGNVGEIGDELERKCLSPQAERKSTLRIPQTLNKLEQLHYRAYKKNVITFESAFNYSPRLAEYMKSYEKK